MATKVIVVPLIGQHDPDDPSSLELPALETAFRIGLRLDACVRVFCIEAPIIDTQAGLPNWIPDYGVRQVLDWISASSDARRRHALKTFQSIVQRMQAPIVAGGSTSGFAVQFIEHAGDISRSVADEGKLADLIVTAHPATDSTTIDPLILEIALRETGRPVLVAPPTPIATIGEHVAIAWNGSSEAARAVAMALDVLGRASRVTVLSVIENGGIEPDGTRLANYLKYHDINAEVVVVQGTSHTAGACLLEEASRVQADLLLMGAYTRSRAHSLIFGGATHHILRTSPLPVILVD